MSLKHGIWNLKSVIKVLLIFILSIPLTGCLFMRPYTPSARLMPENQISYSFAGGAMAYTEQVVTDDYTDYGYYTQVSGSSLKTNKASGYYLDSGARVRVPGSNLEIGANLANFSYLSFDVKYAFTTPGQDVPLIAFDAALYITSLTNPGIGYSAGPVINFPLIEESSFDIVTAAYYQYCDYKSFGEFSTESGYDDYSGYTEYAVAPSKNSVYLYAGVEFALADGTVIAPGVSYTHFLASSFQPGIITGGVAVKYGSAVKKEPTSKNSTAKSAQNNIEPGFYVAAAESRIKTGRIKEASVLLSRGLENYPGDYELSLMQGFCLVRLGMKKLALKYYKDALTLDPNNTDLKLTVITLRKEILGR
jgi:tetratricopeptide (TPR) repeat protein